MRKVFLSAFECVYMCERAKGRRRWGEEIRTVVYCASVSLFVVCEVHLVCCKLANFTSDRVFMSGCLCVCGFVDLCVCVCGSMGRWVIVCVLCF